MTRAEANIIFKAWQEYLEVGDKLSKLMLRLPASILPYPIDILEEALNIIAKDCFDSGDKRTSEEIQRLMALHLFGYYVPETGKCLTDEESLKDMRNTLNLILDNPSLKEAVLENLKSCQQSWMDTRRIAAGDELRQFAGDGAAALGNPASRPKGRDWLNSLLGRPR